MGKRGLKSLKLSHGDLRDLKFPLSFYSTPARIQHDIPLGHGMLDQSLPVLTFRFSTNIVSFTYLFPHFPIVNNSAKILLLS